MAPDNLEAHVFLAGALLALGRAEEARPVIDEIRRLRPGFSLEGFVNGQPDKDRAVLSRLVSDLEAAGLP